MCGLFGLTRFNCAAMASARAALATLKHRGPDDWGDWSDNNVYLGHRRLSIIDLSDRGRQPMVAGERMPVVVTANGEIYNFKQLRSELKCEAEFSSNSDSEVLLHGYRRWGIEGLLRRIEGMFAFALYDSSEGKVFLCRDRVGIKPLYYGAFGTQVIWASELKAIVAYKKGLELPIDKSAVYDFLTYRYIPSPKTLYQSVCKLEPASCLEIDIQTGRTAQRRYWSLSTALDAGRKDSKSVVRQVIRRSVRDQLISDATLGVFLSGGIDSSVVASEASKAKADLNTFAVFFGEDEKQDRYFSTLVADKLGTTHTLEQVEPADAFGRLELLREHFDEPFADFSFFPTWQIAEVAAKRVKVVLSGDGGDEVFGGYSWYWNDQLTRRRGRTLQRAAELIGAVPTGDFRVTKSAGYRLHNRLLGQLALYARLVGSPDEACKKRYRAKLGIPKDYDDLWHFRRYFRPDLPTVTRFQYLDFHTFLPDDVLTKVDRASMAVSLEVRVPLLDRAVIEAAFSIPESVRFDSGRAKGLLKKAFGTDLPQEVFCREKVGFGLPRSAWSAQDKRSPLLPQELVLAKAFPELGIVD